MTVDLQYAWDTARIIHRDIKPTNILVDEDGTVKVGDLGLVKLVDDKGFATLANGGMCSPHYCSPEQAEGKADLDCRCDIYSLGATLYHLVTGIAPFQDAGGSGPLVKHVTCHLEDPRRLAPRLSVHVVQLLRKMMAKDRAERQPSWDQVLADLARVRSGRPLAHPLPSHAASTVVFDGATPRRTGTTTPSPAGRTRKRSAASQSPRTRRQQPLHGGNRHPVRRAPVAAILTTAIVAAIVLGVVVRGVVVSHRRDAALRLRTEQIAAQLNQVKRYRETSPDDYAGALRMLEKTAGEARGTRLAKDTKDWIVLVQRKRDEALQKTTGTIRTKVEALQRGDHPEAALEYCQDYDGAFREETAAIRSELAASVRRQMAESRVREDVPVASATPAAEEAPATSAAVAPGTVPSELTAAREIYEKAAAAIHARVERSLAELRDQYTETLPQLRARAQTEGNLQSLMQLTEEEKRFRSSPVWEASVISSLPALRALQRKCQDREAELIAKRDDQVRVLTGQYESRLPGLQKELTRDSRIEDALAVKTVWEKMKRERLEQERLEKALASIDAEVEVQEPSPSEEEPAEPVRLDALDALIVGEHAKIERKGDGIPNIGMWTDVNDRVTWTTEALVAGDYRVELVLSCQASAAGSEYIVDVGDQHVRGTVPSTGTWRDFATVSPGRVTVRGAEPINVCVRAITKPGLGVMNLRTIIFTPEPGSPATE